jgi:hypothetical protein
MKKIFTLGLLVLSGTAYGQWITSGSNIFNTNSGYVGIGTGIPAYKLDVLGSGSTAKIRIRSNSAPNSAAVEVDASGIIGSFESVISPSSRVRIGSQNTYDFSLFTNNTDRMTITSSGQVGIGLSGPSQNLDVIGRVKFRTDAWGVTAGAWFTDLNGNENAFLGLTGGTSSSPLGIYHGGTWRLAVDQSGYVGIGTITPAAALDVKGNILLGSSDGNKAIYTWSAGDTNWRIGMSASPGFSRSLATAHVQYVTYGGDGTQGFALGVNGGESSLEVNNNHQAYFRGKVGVGTTNPNAALEVVGPNTGSGAAIRAGGGGDVVLNPGGSLFFDGNYNYAAGNYIRPVGGANTQGFFTSGVERVRIAANGNVGVGTASPNHKLDVNGSINATSLYVNGSPFVGASQWTTSSSNIYYSSGNVGVGTNSPRGKFDVDGPGDIYLTDEVNAGTPQSLFLPGHLYLAPHGSSDISYIQARRFNTSGSNALRFRTVDNGSLIEAQHIDPNGNIGFGTTTPQKKIHINGGSIVLDDAYPIFYTGTGTSELNRYLQIINSPSNGTASGLKVGGVLVSDAYNYANPSKNDLIVKGKVGIGTPLTTNPQGYLLAVNGKIGAKEVRVETTATPWPDFVFDSNYQLTPLSEVEKFIQQNKHLIDVPNAKEVEKDGHDLGSMDAILLKKIEELTLYIIEQDKKIKALEALHSKK